MSVAVTVNAKVAPHAAPQLHSSFHSKAFESNGQTRRTTGKQTHPRTETARTFVSLLAKAKPAFIHEGGSVYTESTPLCEIAERHGAPRPSFSERCHVGTVVVSSHRLQHITGRVVQA